MSVCTYVNDVNIILVINRTCTVGRVSYHFFYYVRNIRNAIKNKSSQTIFMILCCVYTLHLIPLRWVYNKALENKIWLTQIPFLFHFLTPIFSVFGCSSFTLGC